MISWTFYLCWNILNFSLLFPLNLLLLLSKASNFVSPLLYLLGFLKTFSFLFSLFLGWFHVYLWTLFPSLVTLSFLELFIQVDPSNYSPISSVKLDLVLPCLLLCLHPLSILAYTFLFSYFFPCLTNGLRFDEVLDINAHNIVLLPNWGFSTLFNVIRRTRLNLLRWKLNMSMWVHKGKVFPH